MPCDVRDLMVEQQLLAPRPRGRPRKYDSIPSQAAIAAYLLAQPDMRHTLVQVIFHFTGVAAETTLGWRCRSREHQAWIYAVTCCREELAAKLRGGQFRYRPGAADRRVREYFWDHGDAL